jgi:hypothetical protein
MRARLESKARRVAYAFGMTRPQHRATPTAVSMRRWLCAWLTLLIVLQVAASALAGLRGSLHRHRADAVAGTSSATPLVRWEHKQPEAQVAHRALHARGEWHAHELYDTSVMPLTADIAADALAQLALAFAPAHAGVGPALGPDTARHARPHAAPWWAATRAIAPPLQPPRA